MEVKKSTKEIPIHPPSPSPTKPNTTETKTQTLNHSNPDPNPNPDPNMIRYKECQRNHAAHLGSHVVDGCGEFMPSGEGETPLALKCAACNCHRNFHRKEVAGEITTVTTIPPVATSVLPFPSPPSVPPILTTPNGYISFSKVNKTNLQGPHHHHHRRPGAAVMMAFGGGGNAAESSSDDLKVYRGGNMEYCGSGQLVEEYGLSKKRFRTKFSQEQKDKMMEFAEKLGWRIQKQDDVQVQRFCNEVGVKRQVFKVWMHNNKQALKKKQA